MFNVLNIFGSVKTFVIGLLGFLTVFGFVLNSRNKKKLELQKLETKLVKVELEISKENIVSIKRAVKAKAARVKIENSQQIETIKNLKKVSKDIEKEMVCIMKEINTEDSEEQKDLVI